MPSGTGAFAADTTHLLLGQMIVGPGADTLNVWVDPDLTQPLVSTDDLPTANFTSTTVDFLDSIARLGVPLSHGTASRPHVDAIWMSNTDTAFQDVTGVAFFIPEPSTAVLAALGLAGLTLRRRRKSRTTNGHGRTRTRKDFPVRVRPCPSAVHALRIPQYSIRATTQVLFEAEAR